LRLFSFGGYGLALAALALVVFGAYDSYPFLLTLHFAVTGLQQFKYKAEFFNESGGFFAIFQIRFEDQFHKSDSCPIQIHQFPEKKKGNL